MKKGKVIIGVIGAVAVVGAVAGVVIKRMVDKKEEEFFDRVKGDDDIFEDEEDVDVYMSKIPVPTMEDIRKKNEKVEETTKEEPVKEVVEDEEIANEEVVLDEVDKNQVSLKIDEDGNATL